MNTHPEKREAAETQKATSMRESGPGEVVVSRTDLERVLNDYFDGVFDEPGIAIAHRLRAAVLNTENQT